MQDRRGPAPATVRGVVDAYLAEVADHVEGLYLNGSVALDDFMPERSFAVAPS